MRVAVVGAGVMGASVAWHLARRRAEVLVIDSGAPGAGVSNWSFAWVNASTETQNRAYFDLRAAGLEAHCELASTLPSGDWWHRTGHLRWAEDPVAVEALASDVAVLRSWGYRAECWPAEEVGRLLEPDVRFPAEHTPVAVFSAEGWVDARRLVRRLVDDAVGGGARVHLGRPLTDIIVDGGRVAGIVLSDGERHDVDAVVNAAGPAGGAVARMIGRQLPLRDEPGVVARLDCGREPIGRAMHTPHVELRPDGPGRVVVHSREIDALIVPGVNVAGLSERLHRLACEVVPTLRSSAVLEAAIAWRPIPGDGLPSIGGIQEIAGYYEAVTHSGVTLAAVIGRCLAREIMDGDIEPVIAPYRPDRFNHDPSYDDPARG